MLKAGKVWGGFASQTSSSRLCLTDESGYQGGRERRRKRSLIFEYDIECVYDPRQVSKNRQEDID